MAGLSSLGVSVDVITGGYSGTPKNASKVNLYVAENNSLSIRDSVGTTTSIAKVIDLAASVVALSGDVSKNAAGVRYIQTNTFVDPGGNDGDIVYIV